MLNDRFHPKGWIFDIDGTLYDQAMLRRRIVYDILSHCLIHPFHIDEIVIVSRFRKVREDLALSDERDLEVIQYERVAYQLGIPLEKVRNVVQKWIFDKPLPYLSSARRPGIEELFARLKARHIPIGIYSDYPASKKMEALGMAADVLVCSTDRDVDRFKPDGKGLVVAAQKLNLLPEQCIFIGDRDEKDGLCARNAGMPYLILTKHQPPGPNQFNSFSDIMIKEKYDPKSPTVGTHH